MSDEPIKFEWNLDSDDNPPPYLAALDPDDMHLIRGPAFNEVSGTIELPSEPPDKLTLMKMTAQWTGEIQCDAERDGEYIVLTAVYPDGMVKTQHLTVGTEATLTIEGQDKRVRITALHDDGTGFSFEVLA